MTEEDLEGAIESGIKGAGAAVLRKGWSYGNRIHVMQNSRPPRDGARTVRASPLFARAQTCERETHEMYGVFFEGNQRLTPFLLEHWQGTLPMRRGFDTREFVEDTFGSTVSTED